MTKLCFKVGSYVKESDLFGIPVQLTYKGQSAFNTLCGGIVSLMLISGLSIYFIL